MLRRVRREVNRQVGSGDGGLFIIYPTSGGRTSHKQRSEVKIDKQTGLTEGEQKVMDNLLYAMAEYSKLPRQHPSEIHEFVLSLHRLQELLAIRVTRRAFPAGWYGRSYP